MTQALKLEHEAKQLFETESSLTREMLDTANEEHLLIKAEPGVTEYVVRLISADKKEPEWMLQLRLKALEIFQNMPLPTWGPDLSKLHLNEITYFAKPDAKESKRWEDVPEDIRRTFERLGIPEAERTVLAGAGSQYDSEMVYHNLKEEWAKQGVIFENMDVALQQYPELVKQYFMKCVPISDHKFAALHGAVWSGGTFIYIPKGVKMQIPLQAYFRMNTKGAGQFEHTLIIVDEGAEVMYIEGCSAPQYTANSLHAGCVEVFVKKGARARYSSVENWSKNTYNLNTKRAIVEEDGFMEWIGGNMGCLTGDSQVFTNPKGPVSIKSIEAGDKVYVWDAKTNSIKKSKVKAKIFSGNKKVYKLRTTGREIEASANHPFLTLTRTKNKSEHKKAFFHTGWKPLEELKPGDLIGIVKKLPIEGLSYQLPKIKVGEIINSNNQYSTFKTNTAHLYNKKIRTPEQTNEDFMWLMGLILGDGFVDMKENKINIATHETEDYREHLCAIIEKLFNYQITQKKDRYIVINSKILCVLFQQIGFTGKANTKNIPNWVFTLPENEILAFLAGYFDSDGHVQKDRIAFTSINRKMLEDIKTLGISVGFTPSNIVVHRKAGKMLVVNTICNAHDSWRLFLGGKKIKILPTRCARKRLKIEKANPKRNYVSAAGLNFHSKVNQEVGFAKITNIEYTGIKPTYDIEVENYHNFISNGLIVHNSAVTMLYPCSILKGRRARADHISIAYAGKGQDQDTGAKVIHLAPETSCTIKAKSISKDGGTTTYRGLLKINKGATDAKAHVLCDALILDKDSISNTTPHMEINEQNVDIAHEATTGRISEEKLFYLMSRGLTEDEAVKLVVSGFIEPIVKQLPLEYAVELNRLIELEIEGVG